MPARFPSTPRLRAGALAAGIAISLVLAACGSKEEALAPLPAAKVAAALKAPAPGQTPAQRVLDVQAGKVLQGDGKHGKERLAAKVDGLKGTPVVVNLWADWCGPCKKELPLFQRAALANRGKVAFLGLATRSDRARSEQYLTTIAMPYPSLLDDDEEVVRDTGIIAVPKTIFYPADRKVAPYVKQGSYRSLADLNEDIARYAQ